MEVAPYLRTPVALTIEGKTHPVSGWSQALHFVAAFAQKVHVLPDAYKETDWVKVAGQSATEYIGDNIWVRTGLPDGELFARVRHLSHLLYVNGFLRVVVGYIDDTQTVLPDPADTAE